MKRNHLTRRSFLAGAASASTLGSLPGLGSSPSAAAQDKPTKPVPLIHQTDLFRPHCDPDDHFDLACVYALAQRGAVNLLGVLCDFPPIQHKGDPDVAAVAMLNHLTGLAAPLVVGTPQRPTSRRDKQETGLKSHLGGVNWLLQKLRESPEGAAITIVGSCRDVALAIRREPEVFARHCRGIYLNAGTGTPDPQPGDRLEYNVELDPGTYASLFDVPCPLYWLPCFECLRPGQGDPAEVKRHGSYYQFAMGEVLPSLSAPMQRFFLSMLEHESGSGWLRSLSVAVDPKKLAWWGKQMRNMWCTAGFLHLAGLALQLPPLAPSPPTPLPQGRGEKSDRPIALCRYRWNATTRAARTGVRDGRILHGSNWRSPIFRTMPGP